MESDPRSGDPLAQGGFETLCGHYAEHRLAHGGAVSPPIYQTSTFVYPDAEAFERRDLRQSPYYDYTRRGNPTTAMLEAKVARLEAGTWGRAFASGMGAISCAIGALVRSGAHVVAVGHCYQPTHRYLADYLSRFDVKTTFVAGTRTEDFVSAIRADTQLVYLESPTTGYMELLDIRAIVDAAHARDIPVIFDNSWATPYFQRPLELGCDLVVHSGTKYLGGHSDAIAGFVVGRDESLCERILAESELIGATPDPFASWLLVRGLRTLGLRMERHHQNGLAVAKALAAHPAVQQVYHPGLEEHPQRELVQRQLRGFSSLFSFTLSDQSREATHRFLNRLRLFGIGVSWGGFESLAVGGLFFNPDRSQGPWLIRLHVGLETVADLVADVQQALEE